MSTEPTAGFPRHPAPGTRHPAPRAAERTAQQRRTRRAIVTATMALLRDNQQTPTIEQIAAAADVARRTIYLHFPSLDHLLLDATSGLLSEADVDAELDLGAPGDDAAARVAALARALCNRATLPLGRQIIALTVTDGPGDGPVKRGFRRMDWIERTVEPLRPRLSDEQHQRLVSALAVALGWEAMVVLQDICGLDAERERAVMTWLATTTIQAMINEIGSGPTAPGGATIERQ